MCRRVRALDQRRESASMSSVERRQGQRQLRVGLGWRGICWGWGDVKE